jgi:hypothetical protein
MPESVDLREYIPNSCRDRLDREANDLHSEVPALARDKQRMGEVDQAVKSLPSHHDLHLGDARDLSMIDDESVDLVVTAPP